MVSECFSQKRSASERLPSVLQLDDTVTLTLEDAANHYPHLVLIFDQENGLGAAKDQWNNCRSNSIDLPSASGK
jgi:hypothetical protein